MSKKLQLLLSALFMVLVTNSQTLYVDGWDWPIGNRGYAPDGVTEIDLEENIDPEINNLYPNLLYLDNPDRECTGDCLEGDSLYNYGDIGEYNGKGIHIGEDWNFGSGDDDAGMEAFAPANGQVVAIILVNSGGPTVFGWMVKLKHYYSDGSHKYTTLKHVTTLDSVSGGICLSSADFTVSVGDWVLRGQPIARIATGYDNPTYATHLHFEMQDESFDYDLTDDWYPRDNAKQSYGGAVNCVGPCLNSGVHSGGMAAGYVEIAYLNASRDGFIDPSDYIQLNRPSLYAEPAPAIEWQNTIGGSNYEQLNEIAQTNDGGYILGGWSSSNISGDKTEDNLGIADYWIVKTNSLGVIEWENTIGGASEDNLISLQQTSDGGYILGGYSLSDISADKAEGMIGGAIDESDYWIVKLDGLGNIEWENTIGGNYYDGLISVQQTLEGGYILGGISQSGISGDKTEESLSSTFDYWIVKVDLGGEIQWQNTIGTSSDDFLTSMQQTLDGGYILGGYTKGGITGDKTEPNLGLTDQNDYWVIKLDTIGNIEWQNTIGGNYDDNLQSVIQTLDSGYLIGGYSNSEISSDKTEQSLGGYDYWIVKLDYAGNINWQNTIGGSDNDYLYDVDENFDNSYIVGGTSSSGISGDKNEGNTSGDYWIIKLHHTGTTEWQNTIGGNNYDELRCVEKTNDGGYIISGWSASDISVDKNEPCLGFTDYWIVKLASNCTPTSEICNGIDDNCDGLTDNGVVETVSISAGGSTTFCQGGSVVLTATHSGESIQWKKNEVYISGATSSTYTATTSGMYSAVTTSACGAATSAGINVVSNKNPTATITAGGPTTFCSGGSVTLTANAGGGLSYQWYKGATAIAGATSINYTATTTGNYKCRVTKTATGCFKNSNAITVSVTCKSGVDGFENISIYPNPASNNIIINFNEVTPNTYIVILNSIGQITLKEFIISESTELNVSTLATGLYTINLLRNGNIIHSEKIIIE